MVELGKYAVEVMSAYAASLLIIVGLVWQSWARSRKVRAELERAEAGLAGDS